MKGMLVGALALFIGGTTLSAQQAAPLGVQRQGNPIDLATGPAATTLGPRTTGDGAAALAGRFLTGAAGSALGMVAGGAAGASTYRAGTSEFDGMAEMIEGALIGSAVSGGVLAALPNFGSSCSRSKRVTMGVLGSVLGAAAGTAIGFAAENLAVVAIGNGVGSAAGGTLGAALCR